MGVLVVASVGNGGDPGALAPVEAPADCSLLVPGVIAVAGLRNVGTKVGFSSFGAEASIAAGFVRKEISALWPDKTVWRLTERRAGLFSHLFVAKKAE